MASQKYYDGTKLLSLQDINGEKPEIYICTSNRNAGKTTYFSRLCVNKFLRNREKFCLVYRFNYELDSVAEKFFKDIGSLFFPGYQMKAKKRAKGIYYELFIYNSMNEESGGESCGYAVALNYADQLKKYSHLLSDVVRMYMDEFQSETNHYCYNEVVKFISIHTSIARGQKEQVRYVPVYLTGNPITLLNPYYISLGICDRLREDTQFLRGEGYVLEQGYNESASQAQKTSAFNRAFKKENYVAYSSEAIYLNDNKAFVEKPSGPNKYLTTIRYGGCDYAIREFADSGIIYCDDKPDATFKLRITVTTDDHDINYVMLKKNEFFLINLRYYFEHGCFRFKNLRCKEAVLKALSY